VTVLWKARKVLSDRVTGTTTDAYANALDWFCSGFAKKTFVLKNTHLTRSLHYKVIILSESAAGENFETIQETLLLAGRAEAFALNNEYIEIKVQVKSAVLATPATYSLDYAGAPLSTTDG
jgi:hypothetical protein